MVCRWSAVGYDGQQCTKLSYQQSLYRRGCQRSRRPGGGVGELYTNEQPCEWVQQRHFACLLRFPANVLHPTNIARVFVNSVLMSIYAGSMTQTPAIGALAILQENLTTGQQSLHL